MNKGTVLFPAPDLNWNEERFGWLVLRSVGRLNQLQQYPIVVVVFWKHVAKVVGVLDSIKSNPPSFFGSVLSEFAFGSSVRHLASPSVE